MKKVLALLVLLGVGVGIGLFLRFECTSPSRTCILCHEIRGSKESWAHGAHRDIGCKECHGRTAESVASLTDNIKRAVKHVTAKRHPRLGVEMCLSETQVERMTAKCITCHRAEGAQWARSGHAAPVATFLTNTVHNAAWKPSDNCVRCHGMFLEGRLDDILTREKLCTTWSFRDPSRERRTAVPCLACHQMHGRDRLAFYSRPEKRSFPATGLHLQKIVGADGVEVKRGTDAATRLCAQCHAANAEGIAGSCDDRSPRCKPDGKGCLDCHKGHDFKTTEKGKSKST